MGDSSDTCQSLADYPNQVWHVDLTAVPILGGFWASWLPGAFPQHWPFCWWVAVVVDHFSRRAMGCAVFKTPPTSQQVRSFLTQAVRRTGRAPKYLVCDCGTQFWCDGYKALCKRRGIRLQFGAIGKQGSIAVVERFIRTIKDECTRKIRVPYRARDFHQQLIRFIEWYNDWRPHTFLAGRTPNEAYHRRIRSIAGPAMSP